MRFFNATPNTLVLLHEAHDTSTVFSRRRAGKAPSQSLYGSSLDLQIVACYLPITLEKGWEAPNVGGCIRRIRKRSGAWERLDSHTLSKTGQKWVVIHPKSWSWETPTTSSEIQVGRPGAMLVHPTRCKKRMGHMKNTGKRIFAAALFVALVNVPLMVLAGVHLSQR